MQLGFEVLALDNPLSILPLCSELVPRTLSCAKLPLVLICAHNDRFSGSLIVESDESWTCSLVFERGRLTLVDSPETDEVMWKLLAHHLPEEQLSFARKFADHQKNSAFSTTQHLVLLAYDTLLEVHRAAIFGQIAHFCRRPGSFRYHSTDEKLAGRSAHDTSFAVESLSLISDSLILSQDLDWCRAALIETVELPLRMDKQPKLQELQFASPFLQVAAAIGTQPESIRSLSLRNFVTDDALIACVYVLLATGVVEVPRKRASSSPLLASPPSSRRFRAEYGISGLESANLDSIAPQDVPLPSLKNQDSNLRASTPSDSATSRSGVRRMNTTRPLQSSDRAGPPSSFNGTALNETSAVASCLKAWVRAESDPEVLPRALAYVKKAARLFPNNPSILFCLGSVQSLIGETEDAEDTLEHVLSLDPEHSEAERTLNHVQLINRARLNNPRKHSDGSS